MKITISWGRNDTFDSRGKFQKEDFSGGVNEYIFGCLVRFPPSPGFPINVRGAMRNKSGR